MSAMEAVAYVAGEPVSDYPACACPVISEAIRLWNDELLTDEDCEEWLKPFIPRLVGTRDADNFLPRAYIAVDWAVRVFAPLALDVVGLAQVANRAKRLRALEPVVDAKTASRAIEEASGAANIAALAATFADDKFSEAADWASESARMAAQAAEAIESLWQPERPRRAVQSAYWASVPAARDRPRSVNSARRDMVEAMLNV